MTDQSPNHAERAAIDLKIEQWREVAALEDRNMRTSGSVIRLWAEETASLLAALRGRDAVGESVQSDSNDYHHTFYGILNKQGQFWTPLPFHDEAAAKAHLGKWARGSNAGMLDTHKIVPVRIRLAVHAALHDATVRGEGEQ